MHGASRTLADCPTRLAAMRLFLGITMLLVGIDLLSTGFDRGSAARLAPVEVSWVRTVDGWQHADQWRPTVVPPPRLHPVVVACGQALFSVLALVAFSTESGPSTSPRREH
jgi:hypothetical protein